MAKRPRPGKQKATPDRIKTVPIKQEFLERELKALKSQQQKVEQLLAETKEELKEKPHISRVISRIIILATILAVIILSFYLNVEDYANSSDFTQLKRTVLQNPSGGEEHYQLGRLYERYNDLASAKREYSLAHGFGKPQALVAYDRVVQKMQAPRSLHLALRQWQSFVVLHPEYRDAWLQIALYAWQVGDRKIAASSLAKALALDETYEPARTFQSYLEAHR